MSQSLVFLPLVAPWLVWGLAGLSGAVLGLGLVRGPRGWPLRALAHAALVLALAGPTLQTAAHEPLTDIVILAIDRSASQGLGARPGQTEAALAGLRAALAARPGTETRVVEIADAPDAGGTRAMAALAQALAEAPRDRVAGVILITDGQVHDAEVAPDFPAPFNVLTTGRAADWDRRLTVLTAPAFAILGEPSEVTLRIDEAGQPPRPQADVPLTVTLGAGAPQVFQVPLGRPITLPLRLDHAGVNVLQLAVPPGPGEITPRNNAAVVEVNGVRDRLSVLLVSGAPHAGERVWRNLLKSDPSVDLVHFTILRPPEKQDGTPVTELSLIAFPTRELFVDKIASFDLIIFDRYAMRDILPPAYIQNVVDYVRGGGTVLVAAGPEFAGVGSLYRTPLAEILPVAPTAQVRQQGFRPEVTALGQRHPVTQGLAEAAPQAGWGRWFRLIETRVLRGQVVMTGAEGLPLLVLDRVGQGRIAVLASDQAWLWGRGFEGGGPLIDLLRRLAHWMLKEPELEEESLTARAEAGQLAITRRSLAETPPGPVTVTGPDGRSQEVALAPDGPGRFTGQVAPIVQGLYRLSQGALSAVVALGTASPREFEAPLATAEILAPLAAATGGGVQALESGLPKLREVRAGRPAAGKGWIGLVPRGANQTGALRLTPLMPPVLWLALAGLALVAAWLFEGRRLRPGGPG